MILIIYVLLLLVLSIELVFSILRLPGSLLLAETIMLRVQGSFYENEGSYVLSKECHF